MIGGGWYMLFGTRLLFRICYFFTAFAPALFILGIKQAFPVTVQNIKIEWIKMLVSKIAIIGLPLLIIILATLSASYLRHYLKTRQTDEEQVAKNIVLNFDIAKKELKNGYVIQVQDGSKINSGFIAFATSVVAPSVVLSLLKENQTLISLLILLMFFLLLMMSNDVFPNIILPIFGIQLMVTKDGYNIFYFSKDEDFLTGTKRINSLGNTGSLARTYVITNIEYTGKELKYINEN